MNWQASVNRAKTNAQSALTKKAIGRIQAMGTNRMNHPISKCRFCDAPLSDQTFHECSRPQILDNTKAQLAKIVQNRIQQKASRRRDAAFSNQCKGSLGHQTGP